jgi:beta-glucosidase
VGVALNLAWVRPATDSAADADAARRVDGLQNRVFLDPILDGRYPADVLADTAAVTDWSFVRPADLATIAAPIDLLGVNYYTPTHVRHWTRERPRESADGHDDSGARPWVACDDVEFPRQTGPHTAMGWSIDPRGLTALLSGLAARRPELALMVTENGAAYPDTVGADGRVADPERTAYLREHLAAVHAAIAAGARVEGYFVWSLMDNFEWSYGYAKRFGIVAVDYATQARTVKDSGRFYAEVARNNAV